MRPPLRASVPVSGAIAIVVSALMLTVGCAGMGGGSPSAQTPAATAAANARMPVGAIPGWRQVFADDFTTTVPLGRFPSAVSTAWGTSYKDGWKDTTGNGTYMPSKVVSISNGSMNAHLHTENGVHMVAALVPTIPGAQGAGGGMLYGRYQIRIRGDVIPGYKVSLLLWPDSEKWPVDGEIDFPEGDLTDLIHGYVHLQYGTSPTDQAAFRTSATYRRWHVATVTWLPDLVEFDLDGQRIGVVTSDVPNTPMHLVIQAETVTTGPPPPDSAQGNVQVDWITAYTPSCNPTLSINPRIAACMK
jgi:beta-glucanase (GH16 family)